MKWLQSWYAYSARGALALLLGVLLLVERAHWNIIQYMGLFWLSIGLTSIAWARAQSDGTVPGRDRWALVAGILGVVAGSLALMRPIAARFLATWVIVASIGVLSILTGLVHILGGFRIASGDRSHWSWGSYLVGLVQVALGLIVIIYPFGPTPAARLIVSGWCLITGLLLLLDARRLRADADRDRGGDRV
jgi:uncharacterized membrane protein HdeD (DUF308 family)